MIKKSTVLQECTTGGKFRKITNSIEKSHGQFSLSQHNDLPAAKKLLVVPAKSMV
jgi:hypothetical protein